MSVLSRVSSIGKEPPYSTEIVALGLISVSQGLGLTQAIDPAQILPELLVGRPGQIVSVAVRSLTARGSFANKELPAYARGIAR